MQIGTTATPTDGDTQAAQMNRAPLLQNHSDALVVVQAGWTDWRTAMVRVRDLGDVHWSQPSGAPRPLIHAFVYCNTLIVGEIAHECHLTPQPHCLAVCVLKRHTSPSVFGELADRADDAGFIRVLAQRVSDIAADRAAPDPPAVRNRVWRTYLSVASLVLLAAIGAVGWRRWRERSHNAGR